MKKIYVETWTSQTEVKIYNNGVFAIDDQKYHIAESNDPETFYFYQMVGDKPDTLEDYKLGWIVADNDMFLAHYMGLTRLGSDKIHAASMIIAML